MLRSYTIQARREEDIELICAFEDQRITAENMCRSGLFIEYTEDGDRMDRDARFQVRSVSWD